MWEHDRSLCIIGFGDVEVLECPRPKSISRGLVLSPPPLFLNHLPQLLDLCLQPSPIVFGLLPLFIGLCGLQTEPLTLRVVRHVGWRI